MAKTPVKSESEFEEMSEEDTKAPLSSLFNFNVPMLIRPDLPEPVRKRVKALKKIQLETVKFEAKFQEELYALEVKFHEQNKEQFEKRAQIISGKYEPTEEECDFPDLHEEVEEKLKIEDLPEGQNAEKMDDNAKGIPGFWLQILRTNHVMGEMIHENDEPILNHLEDIKAKHKEGEMGFTLEFYFAPNEYFTNSVLTKHYSMKIEIDQENPLDFEGVEIYKCSGCTIDWKPGKDVTQKQVTKTQKSKKTGGHRQITKNVELESFFHFFSPPIVPEDPAADVADELKQELISDFNMGQYMRDQVIPHAVLYYTGERDDDEDDEDYDEEDDEEEDEDDEDVETQNRPQLRANKRNQIKGEPPAECKQQ